MPYFIPTIYLGRDNPYRYNYIGGVQGQQLNQLNSISSPGVSFPAVSGHEDIMFAPKCLVLLSRYDYPEVLRNCLCVIYTVYSECLVGVGGEKLKLENLIGHLLGHVKGFLLCLKIVVCVRRRRTKGILIPIYFEKNMSNLYLKNIISFVLC